jgi:hypothetical protein
LGSSPQRLPRVEVAPDTRSAHAGVQPRKDYTTNTIFVYTNNNSNIADKSTLNEAGYSDESVNDINNTISFLI